MALDVDSLISECIDNLCSDSINQGAESLTELAHIWAKAGLTKQSFLDMRQFIVNQACERTDTLFILEKLKLAERKLQNERNAENIKATIH